MMNRLGKGLVLLHVAMSLLLLTLALAIFFQAIDWGWMEPRKDLNFRVASEFDKRAAAVQGAYRAVLLVLPELVKAQQGLAEVEPRLGENHLWYREQLKDLRSSPKEKEIVVKELKFKDGVAVVDGPKGNRLGKPVLDEVAADITKSFAAYAEDLKDLQKSIDETDDQIRKKIDEEKELTLKLNGKEDKDKVKSIGLYDLLEKEAKAQAQIRFEIEYLRPLWVNALEEQDLFLQRRQQLDNTLERLRKARGAK